VDLHRSLSLQVLIFQCLATGSQLAFSQASAAERVAKEEEKMKTKWMILALLAGGTLFAQPRFYAGARFGYAPAPVAMYAAPPAPRLAYVTPTPGPGYAWVGGYWYPAGARYSWHAGYWARPAFAGARWVVPHYAVGHYYGGYWRR
jgi:hypothetical protein